MRRNRLLGGLAVAAIAVAAALGFAPGIPHVFATGAPNWGIEYRTDLAPYSVTCSTSTPGTDASTGINQAISDANASGRGRVVIPPCATTYGNEPWGSPGGAFYALANPIVPKSFVQVDAWGAYFLWTGGSSGQYMMANTCVSGVPLLHFDLNGAELDAGTNSNVNGIFLDSWAWSQMNGVTVRHTNGNGNPNGYNIGVQLAQSCGTTWMNHVEVDEVRNLSVVSSNIGLSIGAGATNNQFFGTHMSDITRGYVTIAGGDDDLRFYSNTFQMSAAPGGPGPVNDGSWFVGVNLIGTSPNANNGYLFDGISMNAGQTGLVNSAAMGCQWSCGGTIFRHLWLDSTQPAQMIANEANWTSYQVEVITSTPYGPNYSFYNRTFTKGCTGCPNGTLTGGYVQVTTSQSGIGNTATDVTGLTATVSVSPSERIEVDVSMSVQSTVAGDVWLCSINEGGTILSTFEYSTPVAGYNFKAYGSVVLTPTTGSHTYKVQMHRVVGSGSGSVAGATTQPAYILVKDVGA